MRQVIIFSLCLLCLAACKNKKEFDSSFVVITKEPMNANSNYAQARGSLVSLDRVNTREAGFFWYSLTPPKPPATTIITKVALPYTEVRGDFNGSISYSSQPDSFNVHAYVITEQGDSVAGAGVKFLNYVP